MNIPAHLGQSISQFVYKEITRWHGFKPHLSFMSDDLTNQHIAFA